MRATPAGLSGTLVGVLLLLTSCARGASPSDPSDGPACGAEPVTESATPAAASAAPSAEETGGVRITEPDGDGTHDCAEFQVTNHAAKPFTYTVTFAFVSDSGALLADTYRVVPSVGPERTVRGSV